MNPSIRFALAAIACVAIACSVLKKEDPEKDVRDFLASFQISLGASDDEILKKFDSRQSKESLLSAIRVLQNKENEFIVCDAQYSASTIAMEKGMVTVTVPVMIRVQNLSEEMKTATSFSLLLKPGKDAYTVTRLDAEEFYKVFSGIRGRIEWEADRKRELIAREPVYTLARNLESRFDSVIWFSRYRGSVYFHVVTGQWENWFKRENVARPGPSTKMGIANGVGELIVPPDFDLVGTIGFDFPNQVEVNRDGKYGLFDLTLRRLVVPAEYDLVIPFKGDGIHCIVKADSVFGWFDKSFRYSPGFPNEEAERAMREFRFVPSDLHLDFDRYSIAEIPNEDNMGDGILVMPSYLWRTGVFQEVLTGISPTDFPMNGYTDFVETQSTVLEQVTSSINAFVTSIRERYLDGREEFYTHNKLVLIDHSLDTLAVSNLHYGGAVSFALIDTLLQVRTLPKEEFYEGEGEMHVPIYQYFVITNGLTARKLVSKRTFAQTEFVKLDSTYLTGDFEYFNDDTGSIEKTNFLTPYTITAMRDEILASYGVKSYYEGQYEKFPQFHELPSRSRDEVMAELTEVDAHNVAFLERMLSLTASDPA